MTALSKNVYFDVLNDVVDTYNTTCHRTIKTKPIDAKLNFCANRNVESNEKYPKLQVGDHMRISKYKNIFGSRICS